MIFLNPRTDITFKRLFGTIENKSIVIDFLNSILGRSGDSLIVDVMMNDTNNIPITNAAKYSIVDIRCRDQAGNRYIVEMQVSTEHDYAMRAQYYSSFALSSQLTAGAKYFTLEPVIFVGVLNFDLFTNKRNYMSHHYIIDSQTGERDLRCLEFHFIELPKFHKTIDELDTNFDKWIYFLQNAEEYSEIPEQLNREPLKEAFHVLERSGWPIADFEAYRSQLDKIRVEQNVLESAHAEGLQKGQRLLLQQMLRRTSIEEIARITGLTEVELKKLKDEPA
jgi:predicted transposase/invertase (TIGR01784 family)